MSSDQTSTDGDHHGQTESSTQSNPDRATLITELERLRTENGRLRESYVRARRHRYRQTSLGFAVLGVIATLAGLLFPTMQSVLLAFGGTGLFTALLTWFITPERFVSADVGDAVYETLNQNNDRLTRELGLTDERVYVPTDETTDGVRLFIPQQASYELPNGEELSSIFVVTDDGATRGVSLQPTGGPLFQEFSAALSGPLADTPADIVTQVQEAVIEQFEIAETLKVDLDPEQDRLSFTVTDSPYGNITRFDHPVVSTVAVALAHGLERPIRLELSGQTSPVATLRWDKRADETQTLTDT